MSNHEQPSDGAGRWLHRAEEGCNTLHQINKVVHPSGSMHAMTQNILHDRVIVASAILLSDLPDAAYMLFWSAQLLN